MKRVTGLVCLLGLCLLLGSPWAWAGPGSSLLRYNGTQLEYKDVMGGGAWLPAKVVGNDVYFLSDGMWWPTYPPLTVGDLPPAPSGSYSGSSTYDYASQVRRYQATRQAHEIMSITTNGRKYQLNTANYSTGDCCKQLGQCLACACVLALFADKDKAAATQPKNEAAGTVAAGDWRLGLAESYVETDLQVFEDLVGHSEDRRVWGNEFYGILTQDRVSVLMSLRYDRLEGDGAADALDGQRLFLQFVPSYRLLKQADQGVDLDLITALGLGRTAYERVVADSDTEDNVTAGAGLGVGRNTPLGNLNLSYVYQPTWNISGEDELTGDNRIDGHAVSTSFSAALGRGVAGLVGATWYYTPGLPSELDRDYVDGTVALSYTRGRYTIAASVGKAFYSDDFNEWHASLEGGMTW